MKEQATPQDSLTPSEQKQSKNTSASSEMSNESIQKLEEDLQKHVELKQKERTKKLDALIVAQLDRKDKKDWKRYKKLHTKFAGKIKLFFDRYEYGFEFKGQRFAIPEDETKVNEY